MTYLILILSVAIGSALVFAINPKKKHIRLLLAYSGSYLLSVTVLHLLPELYLGHSEHHHGHDHANVSSKLIGILILSGVLLQSVLESLSKGVEHGHIHLDTDSKKKIPWTLFISLCIHAFSEGLPIHSTDNNLLYAIVTHKIPIAIVLTSLLIHSDLPKVKTALLLGIFSLMSPLGCLSSEKIHFLASHHIELTAVTVGIFIHISTIILFESTENHNFNFKKFTSILCGIILAIVTL